MSPSPPNIVLLGFMGTGKTTVGRILASRLGMSFLDMDDVIVQRAGKPVTRIFAEDGEPRFRAMERELVVELAARGGLVIGAGGGLVLNPDNVRDYSATGLVLCLTAAPEAILGRLGRDTTRPLLAAGDKMTRIRQLLDQRRPLYEAIPLRIDTTDLDPESVAARVEQLYRDRLSPPRQRTPRRT